MGKQKGSLKRSDLATFFGYTAGGMRSFLMRNAKRLQKYVSIGGKGEKTIYMHDPAIVKEINAIIAERKQKALNRFLAI